MITKLHVQNFKCLRDVSVELRPFTVLIGKNDTGKSSLLEAIHTLGGLVQARPRQPSAPVDRLAWGGADPPSIGWTVEIAATARNRLPKAATYSLRVSPSARHHGSIYVDEESLSVAGTNIEIGFQKPSSQFFLRDGAAGINRRIEDFTHTALSLAWPEQGLQNIKAVASALKTSAVYRLEPERLAEPAAYDPGPDDRDPEPMLAPDGHGLPAVLDSILGVDRAAWDSIVRELREAVPYVKSIRLRSTRVNGAGRPVVPGKALLIELVTGAEIAASLASQGVLLFLAYLALAHAEHNPSILLIEEPENGVHPQQLRRVVEYLRRVTDPARGKDAVQIVMTTHSPYFLDFVPPEDVLVFGRRENGETVVRPLLSLPGVPERLASGFSLGEMWFNIGEDRLLGEALA